MAFRSTLLRPLLFASAFAAGTSAWAGDSVQVQAAELQRKGQFQEAAWLLADAGLEHQAAEVIDAWEKLVRRAKVVESKPLGGASKPERLTLKGPNGERLTVLFKRDGDGSFFDVASAKAEIAAYEVDRLLGLNATPAARSFEWDGTKGSIHPWIEHTVPALSPTEIRGAVRDAKGNLYSPERRLRETHTLAHPRKPADLVAFDKLVSNHDRHQANFAFRRAPGRFELLQEEKLVDGKRVKQAKIVAFDHGLAFSARGSTRTVREWPEGVSEQFLARLEKTSPEEFTKRLGPYLSRKRLQHFLRRREAALEAYRERQTSRPPSFGATCEIWLWRLMGFAGG